jgi:hypothetical protein
MRLPSDLPVPQNLVVWIFGDGWIGPAEGYWKDGQWWKAEIGDDTPGVAISGWEYKDF